MELEIRKFVTYSEEVHIEGFKKTDKPLHIFAVAAVITNPWAGKFVEDLKPEIQAFAPLLGEQLTTKILKLAGGPDQIEAYGKAAVVGTEGEIEHASALTHTLRFGNFYRNAVDAKSYLVFTNTRSPANGPIMIPLMHKHDPGQRSHYHTIQFSISDAPSANEIVIALGGANGGRPHHRIGDRYQDLKELGNDVEDPSKV
ncbi:amino acid synthesis family protein [Alphaproteobacteria bacterium]|nr:amino acid synthesis family protein [Alphaproteobacteria bacterium]MDB4233912.1 amino acid synthesis family protein [Alphaproteobacteria bacterium]MDB9825089.1 amino acid synthesis family protein [Alphaproteobacteria bacterium]